MDADFYDSLIVTASQIAEEYSVSISGVLGLLLSASKDENLVRQALSTSLKAEGAGEMLALDRKFDLIEHARTLLPGLISERDDAMAKD